MLYTVMLFGALGVVKSVQRAHQIARDAADAVEGALAQVIIQFHFVAADVDVDMTRLHTVFFGGAGDVGVDFLLLKRAIGHGNRTSHGIPSFQKLANEHHILC